jgi:hypothetical protein
MANIVYCPKCGAKSNATNELGKKNLYCQSCAHPLNEPFNEVPQLPKPTLDIRAFKVPTKAKGKRMRKVIEIEVDDEGNEYEVENDGEAFAGIEMPDINDAIVEVPKMVKIGDIAKNPEAYANFGVRGQEPKLGPKDID